MSPLYDPNRDSAVGFENRTRRRAFQRQQRASRSGKPMTIFRFRNRFKPPENDRTWIRLIPESHMAFDGTTEPYHERVEHFYSRGRGRGGQSFICSKVWKETREGELEGSGKCILCKEVEDGANNISVRQLDAFLLVHLDWYYLVQAVDKKGNALTYQNDTKYSKKGDPIMTRVWQEADDDELKFLKITRRELRKCEKVFGCLKHWSVGTRFLGTLSSKIDDLMRHCTCGGNLQVAVWECQHCNEEVFDLTDDGKHLSGDMTVKQANQAAMGEYRCPFCGHTDFLRAVRDCDSCADPEHIRIWDVDLEVGRVGSDTQSQLMVYNHRYCELDERVEDLVPDRDRLHRVFAPDSLKFQADQLGVRNPYGEDARRHVEDRDEAKDQDAEDDDIPV